MRINLLFLSSLLRVTMKFNIKRLFEIINNNKKIIENYFFMTVLQLLNSFFYLLIYPYVIRKLGMDTWGTFVFASSVAAYFVFLVNFGFDLPATKAVAENVHNFKALNKIFMKVLYAKNLLFILSTFIFIFALFTIPVLKNNKLIFIICYVQIYSYTLIPQWFFQGLQNMRQITVIQFLFKILSLPFILIFVQQPADVVSYALIITLTSVISGGFIFLLVRNQYNLKFISISANEIKSLFQEAKPFFYSSLSSTIKEYSIPIIIGSFLDMRAVAIYDLANKLILVPRTIFLSINAAIFPKLIVNLSTQVVKQVIKYEYVLSGVAIAGVIVFGKYFVILMGGENMIQAYSLAILLSVTIMSWLVVGAYINFVFLPNNKQDEIVKNQLIAMISFFIFCFVGIWFVSRNIMTVGISITLSGIIEMLYCLFITRKLNLLKYDCYEK